MRNKKPAALNKNILYLRIIFIKITSGLNLALLKHSLFKNKRNLTRTSLFF